MGMVNSPKLNEPFQVEDAMTDPPELIILSKPASTAIR
jgi:hypothetical protein